MERTLNRLGEVLRIRGYCPRTVDSYTCRVRGFLMYSPYPVSQLDKEIAHRYLVYLKDEKKLSGSTINQTLCAMRFLFVEVLHRPWEIEHFRCHRARQQFPVVLTRGEIHTLLAAVQNLKHLAILMTLYSAGLRLSEATHLQIGDIDSETMRILIRNGKGQKGRYVMLSKRLLEILRDYWKSYRPKGWLFPGKDPRQPISPTSVQKAFARAKKVARIEKKATPHSLRHSFAVHLLESGTNLKYIQDLLGHASINSTMIYLKLAPECAEAVQSPLDVLPSLVAVPAAP